MIIGISVLVMVVTGFLAWVFWEHEFEVALAVALVALALELIVAVVVGPAQLVGSYTCSKTASMQELEYDYGVVTGCMVREKGTTRWYPLGQQRINK